MQQQAQQQPQAQPQQVQQVQPDLTLKAVNPFTGQLDEVNSQMVQQQFTAPTETAPTAGVAQMLAPDTGSPFDALNKMVVGDKMYEAQKQRTKLQEQQMQMKVDANRAAILKDQQKNHAIKGQFFTRMGKDSEFRKRALAEGFTDDATYEQGQALEFMRRYDAEKDSNRDTIFNHNMGEKAKLKEYISLTQTELGRLIGAMVDDSPVARVGNMSVYRKAIEGGMPIRANDGKFYIPNANGSLHEVDSTGLIDDPASYIDLANLKNNAKIELSDPTSDIFLGQSRNTATSKNAIFNKTAYGKRLIGSIDSMLAKNGLDKDAMRPKVLAYIKNMNDKTFNIGNVVQRVMDKNSQGLNTGGGDILDVPKYIKKEFKIDNKVFDATYSKTEKMTALKNYYMSFELNADGEHYSNQDAVVKASNALNNPKELQRISEIDTRGLTSKASDFVSNTASNVSHGIKNAASDAFNTMNNAQNAIYNIAGKLYNQ